jgi:hypothetical protein
MGFSSSLQGETAHEALLARQDAELRLLGKLCHFSQQINFEKSHIGPVPTVGIELYVVPVPICSENFSHLIFLDHCH